MYRLFHSIYTFNHSNPNKFFNLLLHCNPNYPIMNPDINYSIKLYIPLFFICYFFYLSLLLKIIQRYIQIQHNHFILPLPYKLYCFLLYYISSTNYKELILLHKVLVDKVLLRDLHLELIKVRLELLKYMLNFLMKLNNNLYHPIYILYYFFLFSNKHAYLTLYNHLYLKNHLYFDICHLSKHTLLSNNYLYS